MCKWAGVHHNVKYGRGTGRFFLVLLMIVFDRCEVLLFIHVVLSPASSSTPRLIQPWMSLRSHFKYTMAAMLRSRIKIMTHSTSLLVMTRIWMPRKIRRPRSRFSLTSNTYEEGYVSGSLFSEKSFVTNLVVASFKLFSLFPQWWDDLCTNFFTL